LHRQKESRVLSSPLACSSKETHMQQNPSSLTAHTSHNNTNKTRAPLPHPTSFLPDYKAKRQGFLWHPKTQTHTHTHTHTQTKLKQIQQQQPRVVGRGNKWWEVMRKLCSFQGWWRQ
jgi:hypothetical protein